jgi:hypothetical protein
MRLKKTFCPQPNKIVSANSSNQTTVPRALASAGISAGSGCFASM